MNKNDDSEKKVINSFTKMLVEISKMKTNTSNYKTDDIKKLVDAIYLYHNVQNFQPDILKTDKKFNQLYSTFLEAILNFFPHLMLSNQLIRAITRNFTWYAQSMGTIPHSDGYCYLICQILYNFPNIINDKEIFDFFNIIFQIPIFISSFFSSKDITFYVNLFFNQLKEPELISFLITLLRTKATFPNNSDPSLYFIIHQFAQQIENNKQASESRMLHSIQFISIYIEKLGHSYPNLIKEVFQKNDFNIFYTYLVEHYQDDSFIQFVASLLATPNISKETVTTDTTNKDNSNSIKNDHITSPNRTVFNFLIQQFVKKSTNSEIQLKLIQSLYFFINEYHVDVNSFEPQNFFVTLFNMPTHDMPEIKDFLLDFFDMLVKNNYDYSFIIFANYLNEYKKDCPFKRLSHILQHLITTFSFCNFNSHSNKVSQNYYLQNLPFFFVESFGNSPKLLGEFLSEFPIFQMLIVVLYQYNYSYVMNDPNPRLTWMKKIIECSDYFDHSNILIQMLTVDPSGDLINKYISNLKDHFSPSLFNVLTTTLHQSYFLVEQFLQFRGLQTIDKLLPSLDDDLLTNLLVSISSHPFSDELNESILKLPNDHIFFHLKSTKSYYRILRNSPIRLPVFLPFVPAPPLTYSQFDLMNISKYAVPIYQRFGKKVPNVFNLINRHLTYRQASEILRNNRFFIDDVSYSSLGDMIDLNADHFPLYEFLPNSQSVCVILNFEITEKAKKSIVFWFKVVSPIYQAFALFHTDKKTLRIDNDFLKIDSNNSMKIERNVWHSAVINNKMVKIDLDKVFYFQDSSPINQFVFGQSNVDCLWVLSPNVRIIENNSIDDFLNKGPQFLKQTEKYPFLPIPNESILVDYSGLPYYFTLPSFLKNEFLNTIENCEDNNKVIGLFLLFLNVIIVNNQIEKYWPFVLHLLSTKTKHFNNYFISYIINFITNHCSSKFFESFILNKNFWKNLPEKLLGYTLNILLSHSKSHSKIIFEFFISFLLLEISKPSNDRTFSVSESTIQIIIFFLSRLSSQFSEEGYLKQLIEIVLFSEKYTFSLNVRLFFIQTALLNDITLTSNSMPKNWILKLLSYYKNKECQNDESDSFYFAVFNLLTHFPDSEIQANFPQESFDTIPFLYNYKYWHYFFALLTGQSPYFSKGIIDGYGNKKTLKMPSIIPSIVSLTLNGLAVLVQDNFNPYSNNSDETGKSDTNEMNSFSFLKEYVKDSFKLLNQICERLPQLFHKDSICLFIQTICPLIPNMNSIFLPKIQLSQSEKFCVNMNDQQLILEETLKTWKITDSFQKEIISLRPEISRFSLQSHSIIIPDRKCELFSKRFSKLIQNENETKNLSTYKHIFHYTNFTQFSVNLLFANSDKFLELVLHLFGFCPFTPTKLFDEYFKLPFQIFISQLNKENLNQNLFEQIIKFIIQGFQINALYNVFSSSLNLLFMFLNNALGFIDLNSIDSEFSNESNSIEGHSNSSSNANIINNNDEDVNVESNLIELVREIILLVTKTGVQKMPNEIIQFLLDSKNIINNEVIFSSPQMVCQMVSSLHVFYLSNASSSPLFLKVLQIIWPINDQSFKSFFVSNFSIDVYEAFQKSAVETDISHLSSILTRSSKDFLKLLAISNSDSENNNCDLITVNQSNTTFDLENTFDLYSSYVYEIEKRELQLMAEFSYLQTAIDCSANLKTVLYLHRCLTSFEKNFSKICKLEAFTKKQEITTTTSNEGIYSFAWPFWISRILEPSNEIQINNDRNKFNILNSFYLNSNLNKFEFNIGLNAFKDEDGFFLNNVLNDYYSGNSIESESNFNFIIFFDLFIQKNKFNVFNARFVKSDIDINTSVFVMEDKIILLLNSSIGDKIDRLIFNKFDHNDEKLTNLYEIISNFEFKKFSFFYSHPVLIIPFTSVLCVFEDEKDQKIGSKNDKTNLNSFVSLHVFTLKSAAFSLIASKKDLNILSNSIKPFIKLNFDSFSNSSSFSDTFSSLTNSVYFKEIEPTDLFQLFENHQILSFEFYILLNALHGRFFDNSKKLPLFPKISDSEVNLNVKLKKGISQCQTAFQYYSPDFLEFTTTDKISLIQNNNEKRAKENDRKSDNYLPNNVVYVNNDICDMTRYVINNMTSLSSKTLLSNFLLSEFNERLSKFTKSKTSINIKNTANKIKKSFLKNFDKNNDNIDIDIGNDNEFDPSNSTTAAPATATMSSLSLISSLGNDSEYLQKLQHFLSTNLHLFMFCSCSSFRAFNNDINCLTSSPASSSSLKFSARESVAVSKRGNFAAIDCPLRCCSEAFRIIYDEKNKEKIVGTRRMATFSYYEFVKMRLKRKSQNQRGKSKAGDTNNGGNDNKNINCNGDANHNSNYSKNRKECNDDNNVDNDNNNNNNDNIDNGNNNNNNNNINNGNNNNNNNNGNIDNGNNNNSNNNIDNGNNNNSNNNIDNGNNNNNNNNINNENNNNNNNNGNIDNGNNNNSNNNIDNGNNNNNNNDNIDNGNNNNNNNNIDNGNNNNNNDNIDNGNNNNNNDNINNGNNNNNNNDNIDNGNNNSNNDNNANNDNVNNNCTDNDYNGDDSNQFDDYQIIDFYSFYSNPRTIINEHDFVAVTFWAHIAILWDVVRGLPLHLIEFTSLDDIIDGMFEENYGLIAFCTNQSFFIYTVNGSFIMQSLLDDEKNQIKRIVSFEGFKIEYKTAPVDESTQTLYLFVDENKL